MKLVEIANYQRRSPSFAYSGPMKLSAVYCEVGRNDLPKIVLATRKQMGVHHDNSLRVTASCEEIWLTASDLLL